MTEPARVLDRLPAVVTVWDSSMTCLYANQAALAWLGRAGLSDVVGRHSREVLGTSAYDANLPYAEAALRGEPQEFERTVLDRDGLMRHVHVFMTPVPGEGAAAGFQVLLVDVSSSVNRQDEAIARVDLAARLDTVEAIGSRQNADVTRRLFAATMELATLTRGDRVPAASIVGVIDEIDAAIVAMRMSLVLPNGLEKAVGADRSDIIDGPLGGRATT